MIVERHFISGTGYPACLRKCGGCYIVISPKKKKSPLSFGMAAVTLEDKSIWEDAEVSCDKNVFLTSSI